MEFSRVRRKIKKFLANRLFHHFSFESRGCFTDPFSTFSYSQEGEDLILKRIFEGTKKGIFIDVGAHHPKRFSNTYLFYLLGWRGINIDAMPGSMKEFEQIRSQDVNIEQAVSDKIETLDYFLFNEPALNTFSEEKAKKKNGYKDFRVIGKVELITKRLDNILESILGLEPQIDFLNVDVEGYDLEVLKSNDWNIYRPKVVLVEVADVYLENLQDNTIFRYLKSKQYNLFAKTYNTLFFIDEHCEYNFPKKAK